MKKQTLQEQLNIYFDAEEYLQECARYTLNNYLLNRSLHKHIVKLGGYTKEVEHDFIEEADFNHIYEEAEHDFLYDIVDYENTCKEKGIEPVRERPFYNVYDGGELTYLKYTEQDYSFFMAYTTELRISYQSLDRLVAESSFFIRKRFNDNVDLIKNACLQILHNTTKEDLKAFRSRVLNLANNKTLKKSLSDEALDTLNSIGVDSKFLENHQRKTEYRINEYTQIDNVCFVVLFLNKITEPFKEATQQSHIAENPNIVFDIETFSNTSYLDIVYGETKEISQAVKDTFMTWQKKTATAVPVIFNKLAQDNYINAIQQMNLSRDFLVTEQLPNRSGRSNKPAKVTQIFENNNVEIHIGKENNISLSTGTRQLSNYFRQKATQQIHHNCTKNYDLDRGRRVSVDVNEISHLFKKNKKLCRDMLNDFVYEMRDLKFVIHEKEIDEKGNVKETRKKINIFDADEIKIEYKENKQGNTGTQLRLNTGTLFNYDPKEKPIRNTSVLSNGKLTLQFSTDFAKLIAQSPVMDHNPLLYQIDKKKYPYAYSIGYELEVHNYMNRNKRNAKTISFETLLKNVPELPTYEVVMSSNKNVTNRIKKPLLKDIQALKEYGVLQAYSFYDKREEIAEADLLKMDYATFSKCTLHFDLAPVPRTTLLK